MPFKIGDIVTPKEEYIANGCMFKIIDKCYTSYPDCEWNYKLQRIEQQLNTKDIPVIEHAEKSTWREDELELAHDFNRRQDAIDSLAYATQVMGVPINQVKIMGESIQEETPASDKPQEIKNKNLFDGSIINNNGLTITKDCASTWVKDTDYEIKRTPIKIDEINKEENNMDILKLYTERKDKEIQKEYREKRQKILEEDTIQSIIIEMQDQVNAILESEDLRGRLKVYEPELHTTETEEKLEELRLEIDKKQQELRSTLDEIRALFEMTEDYYERIKILKNYDILNKGGKLSV